MDDAVRLSLGFAEAALLALVLTPLAVCVAIQTDFFDHPAGYKQHERATPYLGGLAVLVGFCVVAVTVEGFPGLDVVLAAALGLTVLGTIDDRVGLAIPLRLAIQVVAAAALWLGNIRWSFTGVDGLDVAITIVWVVGVANAFNLLDNIDGATATTAVASAAGIAGLALTVESVAVATVALALAGACAGFLPYNLATPSRIFLGDGGSVPVGFLLAALAMAAPVDDGVAGIVAAGLMVCVALFDTILVIISRWRRGSSILEGGRDHSTHRLLARLGSPRRVAVALYLIQGLIAVAVVAVGLTTGDVG